MRRTAVGVDDDLTAGQTGIRSRAAEHEGAGRIHQFAVIVVTHLAAQYLVEHRIDHMLLQLPGKPCLGRFRIMLRGDQHRIHTHRPIIIVVFDSDLGLAIRAQMRHDALVANLRQTVGKTMRQIDRQRHIHVGLIRGVAEHHTLVAGALRLITFLTAGRGLLLGAQTRHPLVDLGALLDKRDQHTARIGVKTDL